MQQAIISGAMTEADARRFLVQLTGCDDSDASEWLVRAYNASEKCRPGYSRWEAVQPHVSVCRFPNSRPRSGGSMFHVRIAVPETAVAEEQQEIAYPQEP